MTPSCAGGNPYGEGGGFPQAKHSMWQMPPQKTDKMVCVFLPVLIGERDFHACCSFLSPNFPLFVAYFSQMKLCKMGKRKCGGVLDKVACQHWLSVLGLHISHLMLTKYRCRGKAGLVYIAIQLKTQCTFHSVFQYP